MSIPGFNAEVSAYRASGRYYMAAAAVQNSGSIVPAQQTCPPRCVAACVTGCRHDGLPLSFCQRLCRADCTAYASNMPLQCGPCTRTCTFCGGDTATVSC